MPHKVNQFPGAVQVRDRHGGAPFWYYRARGHQAISLGRQYGSPEFVAAYDAAVARMKPIEIGKARTGAGSVDELVVAYYRSADWTDLAQETRETRFRYIERFRALNGRRHVASLTEDAVCAMLAAIPKQSTKLHWFKAIHGLLRFGVPTMLKADPFRNIDPPKMRKTRGHHTWTTEEVEQYRAYWKLGTQQRLALELALETVSRRCEVVRLGPQHVWDGWIRIERSHGSADVEIPLTQELIEALEAMPKPHQTFLVTEAGISWSGDSFDNAFRKWAKDAGLPDRCRLHGLKKAGMTKLAEAGATSHELMGVSGHKTMDMVELYTKEANRKKLAASGMNKLVGERNGTPMK